MFDYRGDKVLVDHDSGLGWILLRTEISQRMKSHAVRPCARRRRGCPFPGPPCRPGRRRTCVYGRNELHPSRHGHLTGLGGVRTPRAEGGAGTSRAGPVRTPGDFTSERSGVKSRSSRPPRRERGQIAQRTGEGGGFGRGRRPRWPALGAERSNRLVRKSRFPFCPNKAILSFDVQYQRRRT